MIKFIYFDVGGVVIKDFSGTNKWKELRSNIGVKPEQEKDFIEFFDTYENEICIGRDVETLVPLMKSQFDLKLPKDYSLLADFVGRFERNESIWTVIKKSKEEYKIGLLTNMYPNMLDLIYKADLMPSVTWDTILDSSIEKVCKPQTEIFELAQKRAHFKAKEILFVENSKKHIEAAKKFGWQTFQYDPTNTIDSNNNLEKVLLLNKV